MYQWKGFILKSGDFEALNDSGLLYALGIFTHEKLNTSLTDR